MTNELLKKIFEEAQDALFLLKGQEIVSRNAMAKKLQQSYQVKLEDIINCGEFNECPLHLVTKVCAYCEIRDHFDEQSFSIELLDSNNQQKKFSVSYSLIDGEDGAYRLLAIRNLTSQNETDHLIQQKKLTAYVTNAYESERKRISQELHDSVAQMVYSSIMSVQTLNDTQDNKLQEEKYQELVIQLSDILNEIKNISLDLRPAALDDLGLKAAIQSLVKFYTEMSGITINFIQNIKQRFSEAIELTLYRIVQEGVMNAIKYAHVPEIDVVLVEKQHELTLEVIDLGAGFSVNDPEIKGTGLGLLNMKERAEVLQGIFSIHSSVGKGTHIKVTIPLGEEEKIHDQGCDCRRPCSR